MTNRDFEQKRREAVFPTLKPGFTHQRQGRSGFLYYRTPDRMLEIYTEISGVPEYDFLIWEEGLAVWVYPHLAPVTPEDQTRIAQELVVWLKAQGEQTNFKG